MQYGDFTDLRNLSHFSIKIMFFKEKVKNLQSKTPRECLLASPSLQLPQFLCKQLLTTAHDETISTVLIPYQHKPEAAPFQKCLHQRSSLQMSSDKVRALAYLECNIMSQHKRWVFMFNCFIPAQPYN